MGRPRLLGLALLLVVLAGCGLKPDATQSSPQTATTPNAGDSPEATASPTPSPRPPLDSGGRLLADRFRAPDELYTAWAAIATGPAALEAAWRRFRIRGSPPAIDFDREIALFAAFGEPRTCLRRFAGVTIDQHARILALQFTLTSADLCAAGTRPRTLVVAVPRNALPPDPFEIAVDGEQFAVAVRALTRPPPEPPGDERHPAAASLAVREPTQPTAEEDDASTVLAVVLRNHADLPLFVEGGVLLESWTGQQWQPAAGQPPAEPHPAVLPEPAAQSGPAEEAIVATIDRGQLAAGWYRVRVRIRDDNGGVEELRARFRVL